MLNFLLSLQSQHDLHTTKFLALTAIPTRFAYNSISYSHFRFLNLLGAAGCLLGAFLCLLGAAGCLQVLCQGQTGKQGTLKDDAISKFGRDYSQGTKPHPLSCSLEGFSTNVSMLSMMNSNTCVSNCNSDVTLKSDALPSNKPMPNPVPSHQVALHWLAGMACKKTTTQPGTLAPGGYAISKY